MDVWLGRSVEPLDTPLEEKSEMLIVRSSLEGRGGRGRLNKNMEHLRPNRGNKRKQRVGKDCSQDEKVEGKWPRMEGTSFSSQKVGEGREVD